MSGKSRATTGVPALAAAVSEALHATRGELSAHEEMRRIRVRHAQGLSDAADLQLYRRLWVALSLRRSTCCRVLIGPDVAAAVTRFRRAEEQLQHERARDLIDAAFRPEDGATKEDAVHPR